MRRRPMSEAERHPQGSPAEELRAPPVFSADDERDLPEALERTLKGFPNLYRERALYVCPGCE